MQSLGSNMFFFGVGSMVLHTFQFEFIFLSWIDNWGPTVGWTIRGALAAIGGALWLVGRAQQRA